MKITSCEALIAQNSEKIAKKEAQIKRLQADIKELKIKNDRLNDDMLLHQIKNKSGDEINQLIMISKLVEESGMSAEEIKEMFSKGESNDEN
ncbi:MAG: hypothetical protein PUB97_02225 [Ruminococcus sp.]|nr:hypothetical protein [Ruminococcus sp.]